MYTNSCEGQSYDHGTYTLHPIVIRYNSDIHTKLYIVSGLDNYHTIPISYQNNTESGKCTNLLMCFTIIIIKEDTLVLSITFT